MLLQAVNFTGYRVKRRTLQVTFRLYSPVYIATSRKLTLPNSNSIWLPCLNIDYLNVFVDTELRTHTLFTNRLHWDLWGIELNQRWQRVSDWVFFFLSGKHAADSMKWGKLLL